MLKNFNSAASSCQEDLSKSIKIMRILSKIVGFDILDPTFRLHWLTFILVFDCVTYVFINAYDVIEFWGNITQVCFCLVTWTFGFQVSRNYNLEYNILYWNTEVFSYVLQGIIRIAIFYLKRHTLRGYVNDVANGTTTFGNHPLTKDTVVLYTRQTYIQAVFFAILFGLVGVLSITYTLPTIILNRELVLPFGFIIPGTNYTIHPYFELNYAYQFVQVVFTVSGLGAVHMFNVFFIMNACLRLEIIMLKLREVEQELNEKDKVTPYCLNDVDLVEIIHLHQDALE